MRYRESHLFAVALFFAVALAGCEEPPTPPSGSAAASHGAAETPRPPVVDVTAIHEHGADEEHRFEIDRREIPSGWTTFRFSNEAHVTHFVVLQKLPEAAEGITLAEYVTLVTEPFQQFMEWALDGDPETAPGVAFANTPGWFFAPGLTVVGGPGFTAPGRTSQTTVELVPGQYVVECYVKTDGVFHSVNGMIDMLTVTGQDNGAREPRGDVELSISSAGGIEVEDAGPPGKEGFRPGEQTVEVQFEDQATYGHLLGHDVHLVRLDGAAASDVGSWMSWLSADGLESPAPGEFLGGTHEMHGTSETTVGETAFFTVNLKPGDYAWVAEVPSPDAKDMLVTFSVP